MARSVEISARIVGRSKEQVGHNIVGICYEEGSKTVYTTANCGPKIQRWSRDLEPVDMDHNIEDLIHNPFSVAAVDGNILVGDNGVYQFKGRRKTRYITRANGNVDLMIPHYDEIFVIWNYNDSSGSWLRLHNKRKTTTIFGSEILNPVTAAALEESGDLYFAATPLALKQDGGRNDVYFSNRSDRFERYKKVFSFMKKDPVQAMAYHQKTKTLVFVTKGGSLLFYDKEGNKTARPLPIKDRILSGNPSGAIDYALAAGPEKGDDVYVVGECARILKIELKKAERAARKGLRVKKAA